MVRSTQGAVLALMMTLGLLQQGCTTDAFCFNCDGPQGSGGSGQGGSAGQAGSAGSAGGVVVTGGSAGADCGGADLETDPQNCGECGKRCEIPGAVPQCAAGVCVGTCAAGFYDLNQDPSDGCEYACSPSNNGVEACDEVDNNCNGLVDEDVDTSGDVNHCGACKKACVLPNAVPSCGQGACAISECLPGFTDKDKDPLNGCEYACGVSNGGVEVCDGKDNDCNGQVDDDPDTSSDPKNCGACGNDCAGKFANTVPTCEGGQCTPGACLPGFFDKDKDPLSGCEYSCTSTCSPPFAVPKCDAAGECAIDTCQPGYHDLNGQVADGCEYACSPSNNGVEICDLVDATGWWTTPTRWTPAPTPSTAAPAAQAAQASSPTGSPPARRASARWARASRATSTRTGTPPTAASTAARRCAASPSRCPSATPPETARWAPACRGSTT
ncbi:MAG: MopE-related protein [Polyangiaceae bacterium]|nr:MopE-related protein [Polyangiaceae bacterium]